MSDQHTSDPWRGDESSVGTDRRRSSHDPAGDVEVPNGNGVGPGGVDHLGGHAGGHPGNGVSDDAPPYAPGAHDPGSHDPGRHDPGSYDPGSYDPGSHDPGSHDRGSHDRGSHDPGTNEPAPDVPRPGPTRSRAQVFIPAPEDLPPFDEVVDPIYPGPAAAVPDPGPPPDIGGLPGPDPLTDIPPAPDLSRSAGARRAAPSSARPRRQPVDRRRLAVVYDVEGPRVRLGLAWFVGAMAATIVSPFTAAVVFAVAAGFAARQVVRAWGSVPWQADVAAGLGAVPVLAALVGTPAVVVAVGLAVVVAIGAACAPDGSRLPGGGGRLAAMGILALSVVPAVAGAAFVLVRAESVVAAVVLLLIASAYEVGDYIVGSGASNPIEGPLAGVTTATLVSLPLALVLVEPYDAAGVALLGFAALACPLGQVVASAVLPGAGAHAPALRRIDTLIVLAPLWAAAAGAF